MGVVVHAPLVAEFGRMLFLAIVDFDFGSLRFLHESLLLLLYLTLVVLYFLLVLLELQVLFLLQPFDFHIEIFLSLHVAPELVLALQLLRDESLELVRAVRLDEPH